MDSKHQFSMVLQGYTVMKYVLFLLLMLLSIPSFANSNVLTACENSDLSTNKLVFFSKIELVRLGECIGVELIIKGQLPDLVESCKEVREDRSNVLAIFRLTVAEAIQMGQCLGVIRHVYSQYHQQAVEEQRHYNRFYSRQVYHCEKAFSAVKLIIGLGKAQLSHTMIKHSLCKAVNSNK